MNSSLSHAIFFVSMLAILGSLASFTVVMMRWERRLKREAAAKKTSSDATTFQHLLNAFIAADRYDKSKKPEATEAMVQFIRTVESKASAETFMHTMLKYVIEGSVGIEDLVRCRQEDALRHCVEETHLALWEHARHKETSIGVNMRIFALLAFWLKFRPYDELDHMPQHSEGQKIIDYFKSLPPRKSGSSSMMM